MDIFDILPSTQFDETFTPEGWFDPELIKAASGLNVAIAESIAASDVPSAQVDFVSAITEAIASADVPAANVVFSAAITEALSVADSSDAVITKDATISESIAASDSESAIVTFDAARVEAITSSDVETAQADFVAARVEALSPAADSETAQADFVASIIEALAAADVPSAVAIFVASIVEALSVADSSDAAIAGAPVVHNAAITEALSVADSSDASVVPAASAVAAVHKPFIPPLVFFPAKAERIEGRIETVSQAQRTIAFGTVITIEEAAKFIDLKFVPAIQPSRTFEQVHGHIRTRSAAQSSQMEASIAAPNDEEDFLPAVMQIISDFDF